METNDSRSLRESLIDPSHRSDNGAHVQQPAAAVKQKRLTQRQAAALPGPSLPQRAHSTPGESDSGSDHEEHKQPSGPAVPASTRQPHPSLHIVPPRALPPSSSPPSTPSNSLITAAAGASSPSTARRHTERTIAEEERQLEEFLHVRSMTAYRSSSLRSLLFGVLALCTAGIAGLLAHWFPTASMPWRYERCDMRRAQLVYVVGVQHGGQLVPVIRVTAETEEEAGQRRMNEGFQHSHKHDDAAAHPATAVLQSVNGRDAAAQHDDAAVRPSRRGRGRMFVWRHSRFIYDPASREFKRVHYVSSAPAAVLDQRVQSGLSEDAAGERLQQYGHNLLTIIVPSYLRLLLQEVFHPFYVFQLYSVVLWCFELYYVFASVIAVIATVSIVTTLLETRRRLISLSTLAYYASNVRTLRSSQWRDASSADLVVGDVVEVATGVLPCDIALLDGGCVVNESMLTGESIPVVKGSLQWPLNRQSDAVVQLGQEQRSTLFSATKVLQLKPSQSGGRVLGLVVRTGFSTTKGSLILSILYPKPSSFKFVEQSYKFIGTLLAVALVGFGISIWQLTEKQAAATTIFLRACDLVTIVVPPTLPLALSVGTNFALVVLKRLSIFCISPNCINMAGKVRLLAFDKTGTLTSEGLEFIGVLGAEAGAFTTYQTEVEVDADEQQESEKTAATPGSARHQHSTPRQSPAVRSHVADEERKQEEWVEEGEEEGGHEASNGTAALSKSASVSPYAYDPAHPHPLSRPLLQAMSCCHTLAVLDGQLIGDPLDIQVFQTTRSTLQDSGDLRGFLSLIHVRGGRGQQPTVLGVREQFDFVAALQRMSVVVEELSSRQSVCYVKGSPEAISALCLPSSVPSNFSSVLSRYTHQGYRVIAFASKALTAALPHAEKAEQRLMVERELSFMGLLLLENAVKPETPPTLSLLSRARLRLLMITGDNPLTAVAVAKECGLVSSGTAVYQSALVTTLRGEELEWHDTDDHSRTLDPLTLRPTAGSQPERWELAVTGPAFAFLQSMPNASSPYSLFHRVLLCTQVFARMLPDQKATVVGELQAMGLYCGFVGDGANDCLEETTPVVLADGRGTKLAREVAQGDQLLGTGGRTAVVTSVPFTRAEAAMYRITAASGSSFAVTPGHLVTLAWRRRTTVSIFQGKSQLSYPSAVVKMWRSDKLAPVFQRLRFLAPGMQDPALEPGFKKYVVYRSYEEALAAYQDWKTANCQGDEFVTTDLQPVKGRIFASIFQRKPKKQKMATSFSWVIPGRAWTPEPMAVSSVQAAREKAWAWYRSVFDVDFELGSHDTTPVVFDDSAVEEEVDEEGADIQDEAVLEQPTTRTTLPDTPPSTPRSTPSPPTALTSSPPSSPKVQQGKSVYIAGYTRPECKWARGGTKGKAGTMQRRMSTHRTGKSSPYGCDKDQPGQTIPKCPGQHSKVVHRSELPDTLPEADKHWSLESEATRRWHPLQNGDLVEVRADDLTKPGVFQWLTVPPGDNSPLVALLLNAVPTVSIPPAAAAPGGGTLAAGVAVLHRGVLEQARAVAGGQPVCKELLQLMTADNAFRPLVAADNPRLALFLHSPLTEVSLQNTSGQQALTITQLRTALRTLSPSGISAADGVFITVLNPIASKTAKMDSTLEQYTPLCKATMQLALATDAKAIVACGKSAGLRWRAHAHELGGVASAETTYSDADRVWSTWLTMEDPQQPRVRVVYSPHPCNKHKLLQVMLAIRAARLHLGYTHAPLTEEELAGLDRSASASMVDLKAVALDPTATTSVGWEVDGDGRFVLGNSILTHNCAALKAAMVGVSLSESEASIAAPFTYQKPNISCVPPLLSEGRSSLVTSYQLFRYISMYSLTQFGAVILTYFIGSVLGNWQYLYQDLIIVFPLTIFMGATEANRQLSVKRPSAQLTSASNIVGLAGHVAIILSFQLFVFLYTQKQPQYFLPDNPHNTPDAYETTALYYFSNFQYLIIAALFALGRPFKASPLSNRKLTGWWLLQLLISLLLLLVNERWGFWRSDDLPLWESWRREMLLIVAVNAFASSMWELYWYPALLECAKAVRRRGRGGGAQEGSWFGRRKLVKGEGVKEYYVLRGEFEQQWYAGKGDVRVLGRQR